MTFAVLSMRVGLAEQAGRTYVPAVVFAAAMVLLAVGCREADQVASRAALVSASQLAGLFTQLEGSGAAASGAGQIELSTISRADPNWPAVIYLSGEIHLKRGEIDPARSAFRALAEWGVEEQGPGRQALPGADSRGGSGLAAVALWRWLQIIDVYGGDAKEVDDALAVAGYLRGTRFFFGMVRGGLLPALPLLEEEVARRVAHVAVKVARPDAMALFFDFLNIDSTGELDASEQNLIKRMIDDKAVTSHRLDLFRHRRQLSQVTVYARREKAANVLWRLWQDESAPAEVRAEAGYEWGNFYRRAVKRKPHVIAALDSAYELSAGKGQVAEKALFRRAMVEGSVSPKRQNIFFDDMQRLLERHPASRLADDALYQVATEQLFGVPPQPERAFETFTQLRAFSGTNDWQDSAFFLAAAGHIDRGTDADLEAADRLLAEYVERYPDGVYRQRSLFWRARIAERRRDVATARRLFQEAVDEAPFSYHGLRARMHLEFGSAAIKMALPEPGSATFDELRTAYRSSRIERSLTGTTAYHERLRAAQASGLYARLREIVDSMGRRFRNRLDNIALRELDSNGLIPAAALLLAWRQDALAARDALPSAENQLRIAAFLGRELGDWPTAMLVAAVPANVPRQRLRDLQNDPRFLATAYPSVAELAPLGKTFADWAWPIDGSKMLGQSLMYGVVRRESAYFANAISTAGALGLFQILPLTFQNRRDCWKPDETSTTTSRLFDASRNAEFWSCWVRKEFAPSTRDDIALMLMRHQAGSDNVREWRAAWKGRNIESDLELQIDTLRFPATSYFVRQVLADVAIADAAGLFESGAAIEGGSQ